MFWKLFSFHIHSTNNNTQNFQVVSLFFYAHFSKNTLFVGWGKLKCKFLSLMQPLVVMLCFVWTPNFPSKQHPRIAGEYEPERREKSSSSFAPKAFLRKFIFNSRVETSLHYYCFLCGVVGVLVQFRTFFIVVQMKTLNLWHFTLNLHRIATRKYFKFFLGNFWVSQLLPIEQ